jgi:hypothetical protein
VFLAGDTATAGEQQGYISDRSKAKYRQVKENVK